MSRDLLLFAFQNRHIITVAGHKGIISSLEHEDGSGFSFNVTFEGGKTVYVKSH